MGLNEVLDMTDSINPNAVSLRSKYFRLWWIKMDTRSTDKLELCLTCFTSQPKASYPIIRSVTPVTSMTTFHMNLEKKTAGDHRWHGELHVYQWQAGLPTCHMSYRWRYGFIYQGDTYSSWSVEYIISRWWWTMGWLWRQCKLWCQRFFYQLYPIRWCTQVHPISTRSENTHHQLLIWCSLHQGWYWKWILLWYTGIWHPLIWKLWCLLYISCSRPLWPQLYLCYHASLNIHILVYLRNNTYFIHNYFYFPLLL